MAKPVATPSKLKIHKFSKEQSDLLFNSNASINIAHGPVRSGKNFIENVRIKDYLYDQPYSAPLTPFVFAGVSKDAVYRNVLRDLFKLFGEGNYTYSTAKGKGLFKCKYGWREFYSFPFKDADDFASLRGDTIGGFLLTEGTLCHRSFFDEIIARKSSIDDSCGFIDTNPDSPYHWLYQEFITDDNLLKKGIVKAFGFNLDSNRSLTEKAKDILKETYRPGTLLYKRMILGLWVLADGLIYDNFDDKKNTCEPEQLPNLFSCNALAVDFGTNNPCVCLDIREKNGVIYVVDEYYYNGRKENIRKTPEQYANDFIVFNGNKVIEGIYLDPSASPLIVAIKNKIPKWIHKKVDNSVLDGIATVSSLFAQGKLIISKKCVNLLREVYSYSWDIKASIKTGEDVVKKEADHGLDALRYYCQTKHKINVRKLTGWI